MIDLDICPICECRSSFAENGAGYRRCPVCDHRWRNGFGGSAIPYESMAGRNNPAFPWYEAKLAARAKRILGLVDKFGLERLVEIGCAEGGLGGRVRSLRPVFYVGLEISEDFHDADRVLDHVFHGTAESFENHEPFDLVASFHVLEHLPDPRKEVSTWLRLASEKARFIIEVPNGSGHPFVQDDRNNEHIHQFSPASLALLLGRCGLNVLELSAGHYESPAYPDCLSAVAERAVSPDRLTERLVECLTTRLGSEFVVYGIGGDFSNYIEPILAKLPVIALVDSSPKRWGLRFGKHEVSGYVSGVSSETRVLACSLTYGDSICSDLINLHKIPADRVVRLADVLSIR